MFFEEVTERIGDFVIASNVRPATGLEVELAQKEHLEGGCKHNIVRDECGWLYDYRFCAICGIGLGVV